MLSLLPRNPSALRAKAGHQRHELPKERSKRLPSEIETLARHGVSLSATSRNTDGGQQRCFDRAAVSVHPFHKFSACITLMLCPSFNFFAGLCMRCDVCCQCDPNLTNIFHALTLSVGEAAFGLVEVGSRNKARFREASGRQLFNLFFRFFCEEFFLIFAFSERKRSFDGRSIQSEAAGFNSCRALGRFIKEVSVR